MSAKQWCVEMSWGWSRLEVPKNSEDFVSIRAALKAKRIRTCGHKDSLGHPKNIETRRLSCSQKALKSARVAYPLRLLPSTVGGVFELGCGCTKCV